MDADEIAKVLQEELSRHAGVQLAYLFGSRVYGRPGPASDVDVAVLVERSSDTPAVEAQLAHVIGKALGNLRVDLVLLNRAPVELAYHIVASGKCVFQRDRVTRVEFEADTLSRYGDYLPVLRQQRAEILSGETHGHRVQRYREALRRTERTLGEIKGDSK